MSNSTLQELERSTYFHVVQTAADLQQDAERKSHGYYGVNGSGIKSYEKGLNVPIETMVGPRSGPIMDLASGENPIFLRELASLGVRRTLGVTAVDRRPQTQVEQDTAEGLTVLAPDTEDIRKDNYRLGNLFHGVTWGAVDEWVQTNGLCESIFCRGGLGMDMFKGDRDFIVFNGFVTKLTEYLATGGQIVTQVPLGYQVEHIEHLMRKISTGAHQYVIEIMKDENRRPVVMDKAMDLGVLRITSIS